MKKVLIVVFGLMFCTFCANSAFAMSFINTIDWSDVTEPVSLVGYKVVTDPVGGNSNYAFTYTHALSLDPAPLSLDSATLSITHKGNSNDAVAGGNAFATEIWLVYSNTPILIGQLSTSVNGWITDPFTLDSTVRSEIANNSWQLVVKLREDTGQSEVLWLDKSVLSGEYTPQQSGTGDTVPEPASMSLLGVGLLGLIGRRFRRKV